MCGRYAYKVRMGIVGSTMEGETQKLQVHTYCFTNAKCLLIPQLGNGALMYVLTGDMSILTVRKAWNWANSSNNCNALERQFEKALYWESGRKELPGNGRLKNYWENEVYALDITQGHMHSNDTAHNFENTWTRENAQNFQDGVRNHITILNQSFLGLSASIYLFCKTFIRD